MQIRHSGNLGSRHATVLTLRLMLARPPPSASANCSKNSVRIQFLIKPRNLQERGVALYDQSPESVCVYVLSYDRELLIRFS